MSDCAQSEQKHLTEELSTLRYAASMEPVQVVQAWWPN